MLGLYDIKDGMDEPRLATKFDLDLAEDIEWSYKPPSKGNGLVCAAAKLADLNTAVPKIRLLGGPKNAALIDRIVLPSICDAANHQNI